MAQEQDLVTRLDERTWIPIELITRCMSGETIKRCACVSKSWRDIFAPRIEPGRKRSFLTQLATWRDPEKGQLNLVEIPLLLREWWVKHNLFFWSGEEPGPGFDQNIIMHKPCKLMVSELKMHEHKEVQDLELPPDVMEVLGVFLPCDYHKDGRNSKLLLISAIVGPGKEAVFIRDRSTGTWHRVLEIEKDSFANVVLNDRSLLLATGIKAKLFQLEWNEQDILPRLELVDEKGMDGGRVMAWKGKWLATWKRSDQSLSMLTFDHGMITEAWKLQPMGWGERLSVIWVGHCLIALSCSFSKTSEILLYDVSDPLRPPTEVMKKISFDHAGRLRMYDFGPYGVAFTISRGHKLSVVSLDELIGFDATGSSLMELIDSAKCYFNSVTDDHSFEGCLGCKSDVYAGCTLVGIEPVIGFNMKLWKSH